MRRQRKIVTHDLCEILDHSNRLHVKSWSHGFFSFWIYIENGIDGTLLLFWIKYNFAIKIMSQQYQVCEIEEPVSTFSVSAVPENWILQLKDGSYVCIWPKEKAGLKIRRRVPPESDGGKWFRYKCRILLDGGNFFFYFESFSSCVVKRFLCILGIWSKLLSLFIFTKNTCLLRNSLTQSWN